MRVERATAEEIALLPPAAYKPDVASEEVTDRQGNLFITVMFQHPPRAEVFLVVDDGQSTTMDELYDSIRRMVIEEPDEA